MFILSDTTDPAIWIAEEAGFWRCVSVPARARASLSPALRRTSQRKSGNIAEWVRRFGGAYAQFLILDADSLMSGETLVRLAGRWSGIPMSD